MRFADIETGVVYCNKDGFNPMVVIDNENLYDAPRFGTYIQRSGGKQVMVLTPDTNIRHDHRPDLVEAASKIVIPSGQLKYQDIRAPKGTILKFVTLPQIAGKHSEIAAQQEAERRETVATNRQIHAENQKRDDRVKEAAESIKEVTGKDHVLLYANNIGAVTIDLGTLEHLIALAKQAPKAAE